MSELPTTRGRARLGVLVPFSNTNLEPDLAAMMPAGVSLHPARLGGYDLDEVPDSAQMAGLGASDLTEPLRLLAGVRPDLVIYGCTSATLAHGVGFDRALAARVEAEMGVPTVTAAGAVTAALGALGVRRIGFASPYVAELNDRAIAFLGEAGIETVSRADIGRALGNHDQGALSPAEVLALGLRAESAEAEALVLSCTDMRAVETLAALEAQVAKPVVSSNQAIAWMALRQLGLETDRVPGRLSDRRGPASDRR